MQVTQREQISKTVPLGRSPAFESPQKYVYVHPFAYFFVGQILFGVIRSREQFLDFIKKVPDFEELCWEIFHDLENKKVILIQTDGAIEVLDATVWLSREPAEILGSVPEYFKFLSKQALKNAAVESSPETILNHAYTMDFPEDPATMVELRQANLEYYRRLKSIAERVKNVKAPLVKTVAVTCVSLRVEDFK